MDWLNGVLAAIGFFLISVFGGQQTPSASPAVQLPHSAQQNVVTVPKTVSNLSNKMTDDSGYVLQNGKIYFYFHQAPEGGSPGASTEHKTEIHGADKATFRVLNSNTAIDAGHFYFGVAGVPDTGAISKIDFATITKVANNSEVELNIYKDKNSVYLFNTQISGNDTGEPFILAIFPNSDPASFELLPDPIYSSRAGTNIRYSTFAKDKNAVYALDSYSEIYNHVTRLPGIDPATFTVIGPNCASDSTPGTIAGAEYIGHDAHTVIAGSTTIPGADLNTIAYVGTAPSPYGLLGEDRPTVYEKDKNHVYVHCSQVVPNADPTTFKMVDPLPKACDVLGTPDANGSRPKSVPGCYDSKDAHNEFLVGKLVRNQ